MFGFNITPAAIMSQCLDIDRNTFTTCNLYNMNKKGVLSIQHIKMACLILRE